tara:strand:- start:98 stop:310 length:213 start_codon:yes stop_codon:yes gene_type:complete
MATRQMIFDALVKHAEGQIAKHKTNVEVYMKNAVGVGEHTDILESIGKEINHIGKYVEQIEVLEKIIKKD